MTEILNQLNFPPWMVGILRYLWYLLLIVLLLLFCDSPERGFRYWGL